MVIPLIQFQLLDDLPMGPGARCARSATIKPLYPKLHLAGNWRATFQLTMSRWRTRIKTFRANEVIKPKRYLVSANCGPWGFHVQQGDKDWRYCFNSFCPWCHMRKVDRTYQLVEKVFQAEQEKNPDVVLWSLSKIRRLPADTKPADVATWAIRLHRESLTTAYAAGFDGLGCLWQISIGPDRKNQWQITGRALVLADETRPSIRCQSWKRDKIVSFRPDTLEPAIASFLRYPAGYLRGKPEFAAFTLSFNDWLRAEKELRFSGRTGVFRKE